MPTFKRTLSVAFKVPNPADIIAYAEEGYQNMMTQSYHKGFHTYLMAALYVPQKGVYLCSLPDGPALALIKNTGAAQAPALWSQIRSREPSLKIHAEDCAAYLYESSLTTKLAPGARYPAGSYIAVHGWYEALTGVNKDKGRPVGLCTSAAKHPVNPTCTAVFRALGVASDAPAAAPAGPGPHGPTGPVGPVGPVGNEGPSG
ncbi:hypothetical protein MMC32_005997 [Xylographa parallela]|nr:hypothetical protein [Xylographa parallela]